MSRNGNLAIKAFQLYNFFLIFLHFLISFKREVNVDAESMSHVTHIKHVFFHFVVYRFLKIFLVPHYKNG